MFGGRADNWLLDKKSCLYRGETESYATSCKVYSGKTNKKRTNTYIHRHTRMRVGMYDCLRRESESELGNPQSGILRKSN